MRGQNEEYGHSAVHLYWSEITSRTALRSVMNILYVRMIYIVIYFGKSVLKIFGHHVTYCENPAELNLMDSLMNWSIWFVKVPQKPSMAEAG